MSDTVQTIDSGLGSERPVAPPSNIPIDEANKFLTKFKRDPIPKEQAAKLANAKQTPAILQDAEKAFNEGRWDDVERIYRDKATPPKVKETIQALMICKRGGRKGLEGDPDFAGELLSAMSRSSLNEAPDFDGAFGDEKDDVVAAAFLAIADRANIANNKRINMKAAGKKVVEEEAPFDPAMFTLLAKQITTDVWNDTGKGIGAEKRGLGPRVCCALMNNGNYDQISELIKLGVDTTLAAQAEKKALGVYSDWVMPIQHRIQEHLKDIPKLATGEAKSWDHEHKAKVEGAQKIFKALEETGAAATVTEWSAVEGSDLIKEFEKNPGTIWGFEEIRHPYVQAAHDKPQGLQPLRMMELWSAVDRTLDQVAYPKLLDDPDATIQMAVNEGEKEVSGKIDKLPAYAELRRDKDAFLKKFREDATAFLTEFAAQIPKGTYNRPALDTQGQKRPTKPGRPDPTDIGVSDIAGVHYNKFVNSFACKVGLWFAKNEGKPVYYCLDGIKMDDVIDYKKVKNKAIESFLSEGGATKSTNPHREVVTMQEVREILKNWDDLKDTVKFVKKGRILKDKELDDSVAEWRGKMATANKEAGRPPAPPKASFAKELAAIDPDLPGRLDELARLQMDPTETDQDARDIVRKSGYLLKIAGTRPELVLKYLMSKCQVLSDYKLIPPGLAEAAAKLGKLASHDDPPAQKSELDKAAAELVAQIKLCPPNFRQPLAQAMVRYPLTKPLIKRSKKLKPALKKAA
jgi:hypothetical protein